MMVAQLGVNVDGRGAAAPEAVAAAGAQWVRFVLLPDQDTRHLVSLYQARGMRCLGVVARESVDAFASWELAAAEYRKRVANILDAVQTGNEPDHESPSSWTLLPLAVSELARAFHGFKMRIGPGLVSGQPQYVDGLDLSLFDALAVHPYGQAPTRDWPHWNFGYVGDLLDRYAAYGKRLWITEYGTDDEAHQAKYIGGMSRTLRDHPAVDVALHFCWSDRSGVRPFGLLDMNDRPKAAHAEFMKAIHEEEVSMPEFKTEGFKAFAAANPKIGKALADEFYLTPEVSVQVAEGGVLYYSKVTNSTVCTPTGAPGK